MMRYYSHVHPKTLGELSRHLRLKLGGGVTSGSDNKVFLTTWKVSVILGFRLEEDENCALLGCYSADR